jgi:hypothetical protein
MQMTRARKDRPSRWRLTGTRTPTSAQFTEAGKVLTEIARSITC